MQTNKLSLSGTNIFFLDRKVYNAFIMKANSETVNMMDISGHLTSGFADIVMVPLPLAS